MKPHARSRDIGDSPPVRAPVLTEARWSHLVVCLSRIPRNMPPFIVPSVNAHHLVLLTAGLFAPRKARDRDGIGARDPHEL